MIKGVEVYPLRQIPDERGKIMHMLRCDDAHFEKFGEIYFSIVNPGAVKGWHLHKKMVLNYAVVAGMIKLALFDDRKNSPTKGRVQEIFTGEDNYCLIRIPPMVWNGFKGIGTRPAIVANCSTVAHDPKEIVRLDPFNNHIPYSWDLKHG
ncbi:MAG TPA: dTDP-4-dehydrorhamnose 3,5-epimerase family protein [Candidatus Omnitrophota bacterium]|nr:dTDP-4-dehydrorhamnose 3,5-epimerase family protein [Candidatus Omnitrophota bacterium]HRZ15174.1 dTDP-4-dehydrorhamnose 3,5-epimerase family protein [Candidatus Omnitrophota bacterium]